jgi:NAD(P)H-hydrate epimerase
MKLFTTKQVKELDTYTIAHEPISSIDLMERAAGCITDWLLKTFDAHTHFKIFAGSGNNGGDALAVARLLGICGFEPEVFLVNPNGKLSADCEANKQRLLKQGIARFTELNTPEQFPVPDDDDWVIDGLFGSGLNRPLDGFFAQLVAHINQSGAKVIALDIPSGLFGEDNTANNREAIIQARYTLSLQFPKPAFLLPENEEQVGEWVVIDIKLHPEALQNTPSPYFFTEKEDIQALLKPRGRFSHKGTYGHALFMGGSYGKMGAAVLASRACLHTGVGLLTVHVPECGVNILQTAVPEAMCLPDKEFGYVSLLTEDMKPYSAIGCGCGMGTEPETAKVLKYLLENATQPLVLDADALNILSKNPSYVDLLPENTIITPHPKEFERLTGSYSGRWNQIQKAQEFSKKHRIFVVLKGAYTAIVCPNGEVHFNSTGNPGMATGGSGDVLCGMILSLLAQGYTAKESALLGVYLHGEAGDRAALKMGQAAMIASNIIDEIKIEY